MKYGLLMRKDRFLNDECVKNISCIYKIVNNITNEFYIGQAKDLKKRVFYHHYCDWDNPNCKIYNSPLYVAIREYGLSNFSISILEECSIEMLDEREIYWIKETNATECGYNRSEGGKLLHPNINSPEAKEKRRQSFMNNENNRGEHHPRAKLKEQQVVEIRQRYIDGESIDDIWKDFKDIYPSRETFKNIIFGKTYKYIGNIPNKNQIRYTNKNKTIGKIPIETIKALRKEREEHGTSYPKLAAKYGMSTATAHKIVTYQLYKNV
jgi:group I intron endonuclease